MMGNRDIIAPEVPRSRHVGAGGVHISGMEQERYYNRRSFNEHKRYVKMDIKRCDVEIHHIYTFI